MRVISISEDITRNNGSNDVTWVEAGTYPIVREFDKDRVMIDLGGRDKHNRTITLVYKNAGIVSEVFKS